MQLSGQNRKVWGISFTKNALEGNKRAVEKRKKDLTKRPSGGPLTVILKDGVPNKLI